MTSIPPPQGMTDVDYEAIEAAVTETVRGRWFLNEFARRTRAADSRLLLDAMARLETLVTANQAALPPPSADPSIRLLVQRIKEIAGHLDGLAQDMRENQVDDRFTAAVDLQARAVSGLMRTGAVAPKPASKPARPTFQEKTATPVLSRANHRPVEPEAGRPVRPAAMLPDPPPDPRLQALSGLDGLPLAQKIALFS